MTSGKAAEMARMGRVEFLHKLGSYGFSAIDLDAEQVDRELEAARELS